MPSIGSWDTTNLVLSVAPNALKLGDNPAAFNSGTFPVYQGENAGSKKTCTLTNMAAGYGYTTNGLLKLDGVDDILQFNYATAWTNINKFTVEHWIYHNGSSTTEYLYSEGENASNYLGLAIRPGQLIRVTFNIGGTVRTVLTSTKLNTLAFNHIVYVKDGATMMVYINGSEASYTTQDSYNLGTKTFGTNAVYGALNRGNFSSWINQDTYQINVYDDAISPARILANYNAGVTNGGILGSDNGDDTMRLYLPSTGITHQSHTAIHTGIAIM